MGYLAFRLPTDTGLAASRDGMAALGITFLAYGTTEMMHGYGFVAVFVAALAMRSVERQHKYHDRLYTFAEQTERLVMMILLVFFGAAIAEGSVFTALNWYVVGFALVVLLVVRPVSGYISLAGYPATSVEKSVISFFGIRGLGSFYYLAFALGKAEFEQTEILWVAVCFIVLVSILMHGVAVTPVMNFLDRRR